MLGAAFHQCPWTATATKLSLSPGILLTEENYSLACMLHAKQTIFSCLHLSLHFAIKAWLGEQKKGLKSGVYLSFSFKIKKHTCSDTGYHRQWQRNVQAVLIVVTWALSCPAKYQHEVDSQWWWWCLCNFSCLHKRRATVSHWWWISCHEIEYQAV